MAVWQRFLGALVAFPLIFHSVASLERTLNIGPSPVESTIWAAVGSVLVFLELGYWHRF